MAQAEPLEYMEVHGGPDDWILAYQESTSAELLSESREIEDYLRSQTADELQRLREEGEFEVLSSNGVARFSSDLGTDGEFYNGLEIHTTGYDGVVRRYRVSETRFPDLWHLGRKAKWLHRRGQEREIRERHSEQTRLLQVAGTDD